MTMTNDSSSSSSSSSQSDLGEGTIRVVSGSGFRYVTPFPWRLHEMLEALEACGQDNIASWLPDGKSFKIHDSQAFTKDIIPKWFKHKCYKSFQRQLHLYGFHRANEGDNRGACYHPDFVKEDRQRTHLIARTRAPTKKSVNSDNRHFFMETSQNRRMKSDRKRTSTNYNVQQGENSIGFASRESNVIASSFPNNFINQTSTFPSHHSSPSNHICCDSYRPRSMNENRVQVVDQSMVWNCVSPTFLDCADDIISLFGDLDGASLSTGDWDDLLNGTRYNPVEGSECGSPHPPMIVYKHERQYVDDATIVSQSSDSSVSSDSSNHNRFFDTPLVMPIKPEFDHDNDLLDGELSDNIISLFGTEC
jgi:hypothetical protein